MCILVPGLLHILSRSRRLLRSSRLHKVRAFTTLHLLVCVQRQGLKVALSVEKEEQAGDGAALGQPETAAGDGVRLFEREGASAERHQGAGRRSRLVMPVDRNFSFG